MNVGDLVEYRANNPFLVGQKIWKAIITGKLNKDKPEGDSFFYTLHFLGNPPKFLWREPGGFYSGFHCWELELLSTGQPDESW